MCLYRYKGLHSTKQFNDLLPVGIRMIFFSGFLFATANVASITAIIIFHIIFIYSYIISTKKFLLRRSARNSCEPNPHHHPHPNLFLMVCPLGW